MTDIYLDLVENFLSTELGVGFESGAMESVERLTMEQIRFFHQQWGEVDRGRHEVMAIAQPFPSDSKEKCADSASNILPRASDPAPTSALFTHPYNGLVDLDIEMVKRQALLFSRVAVIAPRPGYGTNLGEARADFATYLKSMLDLKPLVLDRTVDLIPVFAFYSDEVEGGGGIVRRACQEDPAITKWLHAHANWLSDFAKTARPGDPFFDAGVRICAALTYGHTLAATHPFVGGLYKELLSDAPRMDRSKVAATQHLSNIDLPGFSNLKWSDIRAVRENEECLARWRADLQVAITSVDPDLPPEKFVERFDSQVSAQLAKAALDLDRELAKSTGMARFRKGRSSLIVSAIAAVAKVKFGGPLGVWQAVMDVAKAEGPKEAIKFIWERKSQTGQRALRSHYAVFSSNP